MKKIVIAIDGYSACGKSTTAKAVASKLGYTYIDSGAMYRAVTLYFLDNYVKMSNVKDVEHALKNISIKFKYNERLERSDTYLNGLNVEAEIRTMRVTNKVSEVSTINEVRKDLVSQQRKLGKSRGVVMDGRDIASVVFPDAELKVFMKADFKVRSERRQKELLERDQLIDLQVIMDNLAKRDHIDSTRTEGPLMQVEEAIVLDTTHMTLDEQVDEILNLALEKMIAQ